MAGYKQSIFMVWLFGLLSCSGMDTVVVNDLEANQITEKPDPRSDNPNSPESPSALFTRDILPLTNKYCNACHANEFISIEGMNNPKRDVLGSITNKRMPPPGQPSLSPGELQTIQSWFSTQP